MIVLACADDLMVSGKADIVRNAFQELHTCSRLKHMGTPNNDGEKVRSLGRSLGRSGDRISIFEDNECYQNLLKDCREAPGPVAPPTVSTPQVVEDVVGNERYGLQKSSREASMTGIPQGRRCLHRQGDCQILE